MKTKFFFKGLFIAIMSMPLMSAQCESTKDDDIEESTKSLTDYLRFKNASAHFVGDDVIVDLEVENRSGKQLNDLAIGFYGATDNKGNNFSDPGSINLSAGEGCSWNDWSLSDFSMNKGESRKMRVRVNNVKTANKLKITLSAESDKFERIDDDSAVIDVNVTDNRKPTDAVWTNDDKMVYGHPVFSRDDYDLLATFSITNNTNVDLPRLSIFFAGGDNGNGEEFMWAYGRLIVNGNEEHGGTVISINRGETRQVTLKIVDFYEQSAHCLNAYLQVTSENYTFATDEVRFVALTLK